MDGWMDVLCKYISLWRVYQLVTLGRIEGNFGITVQSESFCNAHILAQEFEHIKIWHLMSKNYISLLISCILYIWFNFAKFHVTCHFWNLCVYWIMLNYVHWIFSKRAQQSYFEIVLEIIYLLNCKYIEKYMVFICNSKPRWWWFNFLVFKAFFFPPILKFIC